MTLDMNLASEKNDELYVRWQSITTTRFWERNFNTTKQKSVKSRFWTDIYNAPQNTHFVI